MSWSEQDTPYANQWPQKSGPEGLSKPMRQKQKVRARVKTDKKERKRKRGYRTRSIA